MTIEDRRLIEDYLLIKAISKEASREKSIRKGHLFALLNNEKKIPTYFFTYNSRNRFIFNQEEKSLHLHLLHLVGNFEEPCSKLQSRFRAGFDRKEISHF